MVSKTQQASNLSLVMLSWVMDGVKGIWQAPADAQNLAILPEGKPRQGEDFAGSSKLWQIIYFCLIAEDVKQLLTRLRKKGSALSHLLNLLVVA